MRLPEPCRALAGAMLLAATLAAQADDPAEPAFRWRAPITVEQPGAFVQLPLPVSAYAHSRQALADLRVVDATGARVPFAMLSPAPALQPAPVASPAALYPLPPLAAGSTDIGLPSVVVLEGTRVRIEAGRTAATPAARGPSPGWLIDLGEPASRPGAAGTGRTLRLAWQGPGEFSAPYVLAVSADLRQWRAAGGGQLMAVAAVAQAVSQSAAAAGTAPRAITQPDVPLPPDVPRFVRLVWDEGATPPQLSGAQLLTDAPTLPTHEPVTEVTASPVPVPAGSAAGTNQPLVFDLGAPLPLSRIDLDTGTGARVAPLRLQGRAGANAPWLDLGQGVYYRLVHGTVQSASPPFTVDATVREVRLLVDERAAPLPPTTRLVVQARLGTLLFAAQGRPPHALLTGADGARPGALPLSTLVPVLADERPRFGSASLGAWAEDPAVAEQAAAAARRARLRPWLLWGVLGLGVAALGAMVWRLARGQGKVA